MCTYGFTTGRPILRTAAAPPAALDRVAQFGDLVGLLAREAQQPVVRARR